MATRTGFSRAPSGLACDGVPLGSIAELVGTPAYVYSAAVIRERYDALDRAFGGYPHALHYALKANSALAIASLLRARGSAADANSIWEIDVARSAGFAARDIVFTGVGKSPAELECAVPLGLKAINAESEGELRRIEAIASRVGVPARVAIRVNPDVDAESHPHISTGLRTNKFGVAIETARGLVAGLPRRPALKLVAVHVHIGSQITTVEPIRRAASVVRELAREASSAGIDLEYVDLGGGLAVSYDGGAVPSPQEYVSTLVDTIRPTGLPIVVEPGRTIVGPAGVLLSRVIDVKPRDQASAFVILDAGMTELLRPALYGAFHGIEPVQPRSGETVAYEVVGPVCESSDVIGRDRRLPPLEVGDLVAIRDVGAYGAVMASNYNRRPLPPEVLVDEGSWRTIRRRQTLDEMLALER